MDQAVMIMAAALAIFMATSSYWFAFKDKPRNYVAAAVCLCVAAYITYGLYVQCSDVAVFASCKN